MSPSSGLRETKGNRRETRRSHLGDKRIEMLRGQRKRADTTTEPGRQKEKVTLHKLHRWDIKQAFPSPLFETSTKREPRRETKGNRRPPAVTELGDKCIEMLRGQRKRADTSKQ